MEEIARTFHRPKSVIWYELQKTRQGKTYDADYARHLNYVRMRGKRKIGKKIALHSDLRRFVETHLLDDQAPEEIAKRLKRIEKHLPYISASAIRRYITSVYGRRIEWHRSQAFELRGWDARQLYLYYTPYLTFLQDTNLLPNNPHRFS